MNPEKVKTWGVTRQMGAWRYSLTYGTIWGFFTSALIFLGRYFSHHQEALDLKLNLITILLYWIGGIILYRYIIWKNKEQEYQTWLERQQK